MIKYLLPLLLLASTAQAYPRVNVVCISGINSVSPRECRAIAKTGQRVFPRELKLRLGRFYYASDTCAKFATLSTRTEQFDCLISRTRSITGRKPGYYFIFAPPLMEGKLRWLAGLARPSAKVALGNATTVSNTGELRFYTNLIVFAHEVAHLLGAADDSDSTSIMNIDAGRLASQGASLGFKSDINWRY